MRMLVTIAMVFIFSLASWADEKSRPNTLTPQEVSEGWVLLFDGATTFGWKIDGEVKVEDGTLILGGKKKTSLTSSVKFPGYCEFKFEALEKDLTPRSEKATVFIVHGNHDWQLPTNTRLPPADWGRGHARLVQEGEKYTHVSADDRENSDGAIRGSPYPGPIRFDVPAGRQIAIRNLKFRPQGQEFLFNGKNLTGWKAFPGKKTKFAITPAGELSLAGGPGDLQTTMQWDDFVLQLAVKSNGPHLESGVFFRAIPNEFWSGYKAQILNAWKSDNRRKPISFGTGGLYDFQPARAVVSADFEWFTMTLLAHGKEIAIWVNGYQTVDLAETRPLGDDARKGGKTLAGPISIQAHDAATNMLFKDIRLVPMPRSFKDLDD